MTEWGIDTLFNPGKRHLDEEKRRLQSTREEVGDASGGRRVDFTAGTVRINRPDAKDPGTDDTLSDDPDSTAESRDLDPVAEERQRRARERRAWLAGGAATKGSPAGSPAAAEDATAEDAAAQAQATSDPADEASS
ncbi:MAG: hypothetical protein JO144_16830 [Actinobacteria bacterium]|nr:hypothetical protein [Actinomycetota bacterium]